MGPEYYFQIFWANVLATSPPEWIAVTSAIVQVLLAKANRSSNYVFGAISTAIYIGLFVQGKLYAEAGLNTYYLIMSLYGLWHWRGEGKHIQVPVTFSTGREWLTAAAIACGALLLGYNVLHHFTDSAVPLWDAGVASLAWAGMWLLARRKVENWLWLNASNAVAIPLFFFKGYMLTMGLTIFLFIVAVFGYFSWRRLARAQR